jgi:hypothetical protein
MTDTARASSTFAFFLAAVFALGLGRIMILPPFEGVDETVHYSRIRAAAYAENEKDALHIADEADAYTQNGPMSQGWIDNESLHRTDAEARDYKTYEEFFDDARLQRDYARKFRKLPLPQEFSPAPGLNWQYQHPPLYYALMGKAVTLLGEAPLMKQLLMLRVFSFVIAIAGLALGVLGTARYFFRTGDAAAARAVLCFGAAYPLLMPVFFYDVARIGNDSLGLFLFAVFWAAALEHLLRPLDKFVWIAMGAAAGACLLCKATLIPPVIGICAFLYARQAWVTKKYLRAAMPPVVTLVIAAAMSAGSYAVIAARGYAPGWTVLQNVQIGTFDMLLALRNVFYTLTSTVFAYSDWLYILADARVTALMVLPFGILCWFYLRGLKFATALPLFAVLPLLGALCGHTVLSVMSMGAKTLTPAHYIHALAPALVMVAALGLKSAPRRSLILGAGVFLNLLIFWAQSAFYSGCMVFRNISENTPLVDNRPTLKPCFFNAMEVYARLDMLAYPYFGAGLLLLGMLLAVQGIVQSRHKTLF